MKRTRARRSALIAGVMTLGLAIAMSTAGTAFAGSDAKSLVIGSKDFAGAEVLSQVYGQALDAKGYSIEFKDSIGPTEVVFPALQDGELDAYAEYQGTLLETQLSGTPTGDRNETYTALQDALDGTGIVASKPAPAVDVNGFYVTKKTAKKLKVKTLSDLVDKAPDLVLGAPPQCEERPLCLGDKSQELYGLKFSEVKELDPGGPITVKALEDGDIDVALLFTGSSVVPKDAVLLTDDKGLQPADNPVLLVREDKATPALLKIVNKVSAKITTKAYNDMSLAVSEDKKDPADVAAAFLKKNKLG